MAAGDSGSILINFSLILGVPRPSEATLCEKKVLVFAHGGAGPLSDPFLVDVGLLLGHPRGHFGEASSTKSSKGSGCEAFWSLFRSL